MRSVLKPAAWAFYVVFVFEILFMVSPFALHFYAAYGPTLNVLHRSPWTAWLTQFFLPHFSETRSPVLNVLPELAWGMVAAGTLVFFAGAIPVYWAKLRGGRAVTGGLYRFIRHPQYVGLAVVGLGALLIWPRFLILITFVSMLFLYAVLARWEEEQCLARFGDPYAAYRAGTGRFLPLRVSRMLPEILPASGRRRTLAAVRIYVAIMVGTVALGFGVRDYSLSTISSLYTRDIALLSPAVLSDQELTVAYRTALADVTVQEALRASGSAKQIVYVVPLEWYLPDLPIEAERRFGGHHVPSDFDRRHYKVLFTRARSHATGPMAADIVKAAYGRDPIVLVKVDTAAGAVTGVETPPAHVRWGDIPTPMF